MATKGYQYVRQQVIAANIYGYSEEDQLKLRNELQDEFDEFILGKKGELREKAVNDVANFKQNFIDTEVPKMKLAIAEARQEAIETASANALKYIWSNLIDSISPIYLNKSYTLEDIQTVVKYASDEIIKLSEDPTYKKAFQTYSSWKSGEVIQLAFGGRGERVEQNKFLEVHNVAQILTQFQSTEYAMKSEGANEIWTSTAGENSDAFYMESYLQGNLNVTASGIGWTKNVTNTDTSKYLPMRRKIDFAIADDYSKDFADTPEIADKLNERFGVKVDSLGNRYLSAPTNLVYFGGGFGGSESKQALGEMFFGSSWPDKTKSIDLFLQSNTLFEHTELGGDCIIGNSNACPVSLAPLKSLTLESLAGSFGTQINAYRRDKTWGDYLKQGLIVAKPFALFATAILSGGNPLAVGAVDGLFTFAITGDIKTAAQAAIISAGISYILAALPGGEVVNNALKAFATGAMTMQALEATLKQWSDHIELTADFGAKLPTKENLEEMLSENEEYKKLLEFDPEEEVQKLLDVGIPKLEKDINDAIDVQIKNAEEGYTPLVFKGIFHGAMKMDVEDEEDPYNYSKIYEYKNEYVYSSPTYSYA